MERKLFLVSFTLATLISQICKGVGYLDSSFGLPVERKLFLVSFILAALILLSSKDAGYLE